VNGWGVVVEHEKSAALFFPCEELIVMIIGEEGVGRER
jgi:hypothetical protein